MAVRKPLVLSGGVVQQLQSGDTLSGPFAENDSITLTNGDTGSHAIGDVCYISANDTAKHARANASSTAYPVAFATATIANGATGTYQTGGVLGGLSGLTAGTTYWLDPTTAGAMTSTAPTTAGQYLCELGQAISTTEFLIRIRETIAL
jgi:hypothetical protein